MTDTAPLTYEQPFWDAQRHVVGVDEVGRGALAGPVTVGAVVLERGTSIAGVRDSKTLTARQREQLAAIIWRDAAAVAVGEATAEEVDALGLTGALACAATRALEQIAGTFDALFLDGRHNYVGAAVPTTLVVKGDQHSQSIAAASIVAKVHRDQLMTGYDATFPQYGFAGHKGYGSRTHREAISTHGVCVLHRRSFAPCAVENQLSLLPTDERP